MRSGVRMLGAGLVIGLAVASAPAQQAPKAGVADKPFVPLNLSLQPSEPESVYAPPSPPRPEEGINEGAVHFDLGVGYYTRYIYRGIQVFDPIRASDNVNIQINSKLSWDLGKLPHPFIGVFVNYADSDPVSSFQEVRPTVGAEWTIRPLVLSGGLTTYLYPDRKDFQTSEVWGKLQLDDSYFLRSDQPLLSPYVMAAYDIDLYDGWYFEAGVSHDFVIEDTGLTIKAQACVAYISQFQLYETAPLQKDVTGFQHYQLGVIGNYSLNTLLNFPPRYGEWSLQGYFYYTDGLNHKLRSSTETWGGAGIMFKY